MQTAPWHVLGADLGLRVVLDTQRTTDRTQSIPAAPAEVDALVQAQFEASAPARPQYLALRPRPMAEDETGWDQPVTVRSGTAATPPGNWMGGSGRPLTGEALSALRADINRQLFGITE